MTKEQYINMKRGINDSDSENQNDQQKYSTETCCVICNYYSLWSQHERAAVYFQRALKLNPGYFKKFIFELL